MKRTHLKSLPAAFLCLATLGVLGGCSDSGDSSLTGVDETDTSAALEASVSAPSLEAIAPGEEDRLQTRLNPVQAPNSVGELARRDNGQFETEVTIRNADFDVTEITPGNGFRDEIVRLVVLRNGVQVFAIRVPFADRNPGSVDFKRTFRAPLRAGDVVRAVVNGHLALRGVLRND